MDSQSATRRARMRALAELRTRERGPRASLKGMIVNSDWILAPGSDGRVTRSNAPPQCKENARETAESPGKSQPPAASDAPDLLPSGIGKNVSGWSAFPIFLSWLLQFLGFPLQPAKGTENAGEVV